MEISKEEIEILRIVVHGYLYTHTRHEVHGRLQKKGITENEVLRSLFVKILKCLNTEIKSEYSDLDFLFIGLYELLSDEFLEKQIGEGKKLKHIPGSEAAHAQDREIEKYALYFSGKREKRKKV